jgi:hypothetical protein
MSFVIFDSFVIIVLATESRVRGSKPGWGRWFYMGDKIHSTTSFEGEVKLSVACRKSLRHVKEPCGVGKRYFVGKIHRFSRQVSYFATRYLYWLLPEISGGRVRNDYNRSVMVAVHGTPCTIPLRKSNSRRASASKSSYDWIKVNNKVYPSLVVP